MPDYSWPLIEKRRLMGKRRARLDGPAKAIGAAKYGSDVKQPGLLYGALLTCPHGHALVKSVDTKEAASLKGVTAVRVISPAGTEIQWAGTEVAVVAAVSLEIARDAVRLIKVEYEVRPHLVHDADLGKAGARAKPSGQAQAGDPDKAFQEADVTIEGDYGIQAITHCPLEPHGQVIAWKGDGVEYWPSTQSLYGVAGELAKAIDVPVASVHAHQQHVGGAFGSKFSAERWGVEGARLSKDSGGRAGEVVPGPPHGPRNCGQPAIRLRPHQAGSQEGRDRHRLAGPVLGQQRHRGRRNWREHAPLRLHQHSQQAREPYRRVGQ